MVTIEQFLAKAREAEGTPWKHMGRLVPGGVDCIGLLLWDLRQFNMTDYEPPPYPEDAKWGEFVGHFRAHLTEIRLADIRPSSVLIFRQHIYPCHCGIVTEVGNDPKFIHAFRLRGKVIEERYSPLWKRISVTAFDVPGLES